MIFKGIKIFRFEMYPKFVILHKLLFTTTHIFIKNIIITRGVLRSFFFNIYFKMYLFDLQKQNLVRH